MRNPLLDNNPDQYLPEFDLIRPAHVLPALESLLEDYDRGPASPTVRHCGRCITRVFRC
jgi:hypothetical protein